MMHPGSSGKHQMM